MTWTRVRERARRSQDTRSLNQKSSVDQIRRMVLAPDNDRGGGALDELGPCLVNRERSGRSTEASVCDEPERRLFTATWPGGTALEDCSWQQRWAEIIAGSQSIIIVRQHGWQGAGARQANAGVVAHRATIASIKIAPFLDINTT